MRLHKVGIVVGHCDQK